MNDTQESVLTFLLTSVLLQYITSRPHSFEV